MAGSTVNRKIIASMLLLESLQKHEIHLSLLVADTGLWASPEVHRRLVRETDVVAMSPTVRRARTGKGEQPGQIVDGIRLDNNSYANAAIKRAVGLGGGQAEGFEACHIWPLTCYDERYHTAPANIVLLPRAIAGLSDHDAEVRAALQYRAFELYGWWPEDQPQPEKPEFYPDEWCEPQPDPAGARAAGSARRGPRGPAEHLRPALQDRIRRWSQKPQLNVHKIIALVVATEAGTPRAELVRRVAEVTRSKNAYGVVANLLTESGNAYGRVLQDSGGIVRLHPEVAELIRSLEWRIAQG